MHAEWGSCHLDPALDFGYLGTWYETQRRGVLGGRDTLQMYRIYKVQRTLLELAATHQD